MSGGGHPLISITSPGSTGPTGSATGGTIAPGPGGRSGTLDAELALTRGGSSRVTGNWTC